MTKREKKTTTTTSIPARDLRPGHVIPANDGGTVKTVDLVLDPRGGIYEPDTTEVLVTLSNGDRLLLSGTVEIAAA